MFPASSDSQDKKQQTQYNHGAGQRPGMLCKNPLAVGALIRNRGDLARGLEHPAFTPGVHDSVRLGGFRKERQRDFENDRINVFSRPIIFAAINESVISFLILLELVSLPGPRPGWKILFHAVSQFRVGRIEIEKVVAF